MNRLDNIFSPIINNLKGSVKYRVITLTVITFLLSYAILLISTHSVSYLFFALLNAISAIFILSTYASMKPADTDEYYKNKIANENIYTKIRHYNECKKPHKGELKESILSYLLIDKKDILHVNYYVYPEFQEEILNKILNNNNVADYCRWINLYKGINDTDMDDFYKHIQLMKMHIVANGLYDSFQKNIDYISDDKIRESLTGNNFYEDLPNDYKIGVVI